LQPKSADDASFALGGDGVNEFLLVEASMRVLEVSSSMALAAMLFVGVGCEADVDSPPPGVEPPGQQTPDPMMPEPGDGADSPLDDAYSPDTQFPDPAPADDGGSAGLELSPEPAPTEAPEQPSSALPIPSGDSDAPADP
jgi:hypothetical protein